MERRPTRKNAEARAAIAARFKVLCLDAGLKVPEVAQTLHVTERTVYAWFSGKTAVPYSAYRLLRILHHFELPGPGWDGWHMHSGKLWTPEGFGFEAVDGAWWSLLVRQARAFKTLYERSGALERQLAGIGAEGLAEVTSACAGASARREVPGPAGLPVGRRAAPPNSFLRHFPTREGRNGANTPSFAIDSIAVTPRYEIREVRP